MWDDRNALEIGIKHYNFIVKLLFAFVCFYAIASYPPKVATFWSNNPAIKNLKMPHQNSQERRISVVFSATKRTTCTMYRDSGNQFNLTCAIANCM